MPFVNTLLSRQLNDQHVSEGLGARLDGETFFGSHEIWNSAPSPMVSATKTSCESVSELIPICGPLLQCTTIVPHGMNVFGLHLIIHKSVNINFQCNSFDHIFPHPNWHAKNELNLNQILQWWNVVWCHHISRTVSKFSSFVLATFRNHLVEMILWQFPI